MDAYTEEPLMRATEAGSSQPFPADPPHSFSDSAQIVEHDWRAFDELTEMTNHWERPGWDLRTRRYYWFLTVDHAPAVARRARECQSALAHFGLDEVPPEGLHVTVARIGDAAQVPSRQITDLLDAAAQRCRTVASFKARAVPLSGSRGAIRFSLTPWQPLVDLHDAVRRACSDAGIEGVKPAASFRPHLGVAYCNRRMSASPVQQAVARLRSLPSVELPVPEIRLVELSRGDRRYKWKSLGAVPLGGKHLRPAPGSR